MWTVEFDEEFFAEVEAWPRKVQAALASRIPLLEAFGPQLGRPHADTLAGSKVSRLKELRMLVDREPWRIAFAFDERRRAILLCGGSKAGVKETRFYRQLIELAEKRWADRE